MPAQPDGAERVESNMGSLAATLDYDAELMVRVKEGDGACFDVLLEKVLQTTGDEPFLVVSGQQRDHARNCPSHEAQISPNLTGPCAKRS